MHSNNGYFRKRFTASFRTVQWWDCSKRFKKCLRVFLGSYQLVTNETTQQVSLYNSKVNCRTIQKESVLVVSTPISAKDRAYFWRLEVQFADAWQNHFPSENSWKTSITPLRRWPWPWPMLFGTTVPNCGRTGGLQYHSQTLASDFSRLTTL